MNRCLSGHIFNQKNNFNMIEDQSKRSGKMIDAFILTNWVVMCFDAFERKLGLRVENIFDQTGTSIELLKNPLFSVKIANSLFQAACKLSKDDSIGIEAGMNISPTTFPALGFAAISSENLLDGFNIIARHSYGITDVTQLFVVHENSHYGFGFSPSNNGLDLDHIGYDAALCMVTRICRLIHDGPADIRKVCIAHDRPEQWKRFDRFFKAPIHWNQPQYCIYFSEEYFLRKNKHFDCQLRDTSAMMATRYFDGLLAETRLTHLVRRHIHQSLSDAGMTLADISKKLNVSERSLQRHLSLEGTSFRQLIDDARKDAAHRFIGSTRLTISEIAFSLGFSDSGNFCRAFKRWYGCSPHAYRLKNDPESNPYLSFI